MRVKGCAVGLLVCGLVAFTGTAAHAVGTIAETGFNDALGINADGTPGSPYLAGGTVVGKGASEPLWGGTTWSWVPGKNNGTAIAQGRVIKEGDLALQMINPEPSGSSGAIHRTFPGLSGVNYFDTWLRVDSISPGAGLGFYLIEDATDHRASHCYVKNEGGEWNVRVRSGSGGNFDTGFNATPGQWHRLTERLDVTNQTYNVWFDGAMYGSTLDFIGSCNTIDTSRILLSGTLEQLVISEAYVDALQFTQKIPVNQAVPEPAGLALIGAALLGLRRRRR